MKWLQTVEDDNGNIIRGIYQTTDARGRVEIRFTDLEKNIGWKVGAKPQELIDKEKDANTMDIFGGIF